MVVGYLNQNRGIFNHEFQVFSSDSNLEIPEHDTATLVKILEWFLGKRTNQRPVIIEVKILERIVERPINTLLSGASRKCTVE
jgi:hypothetical protein